MNPPFPSFLKTALLATALLSAGHVYAAEADGIVVYNAQHESLTKSWIERGPGHPQNRQIVRIRGGQGR